jgi:ABC-type transporter Mla subunit MlaD
LQILSLDVDFFVVIAVFIVILGMLACFFWFKFYKRSRELHSKLKKTTKDLRQLKQENLKINDIHKRLREVFTSDTGKSNKLLADAWEKYKKSLQFHGAENDDGQDLKSIHATTPAELYFSEQVLVDNHLKTELFKQFPALLTGLGICATFVGLILGMRDFDTTAVTAENVQKNLGDLFTAVSHSFILSGIAIFVALIITGIERNQIATLYRQMDELCELLDGFFERWSGEDYLEKLHANSDKSTTQLSQMKDAVIAELKDVLEKLSSEQIKAQNDRSQQMVQGIQHAITQGLEKPMGAITEAVKGVSQHQGQAVDKLLTDVLVQFSNKVEGMFGGQMQGLMAEMKKVSEAMESAVTQFSGFAEKMNDSGVHAVDTMATKLQQSLAWMDTRQETMNVHMQQFIEQFKTGMQQSQHENANQLKHLLVNVGEDLSSIMEHMGSRVGHMIEQQVVRQNELEQSTRSSVEAMVDQVSRLMVQSTTTIDVMDRTAQSFSQVADAVVSGLHTGAEKIKLVFSDFERAGQGIAEATKATIEGTRMMGGAMDRVEHLIRGSDTMMKQFHSAQQLFSVALDELKRTIDVAKRDASMTSELMHKIENATIQLGKSKEEASIYLDKVSEVLVKAHEAFQKNMLDSLGKATSHFQNDLETAVSKLSGTIKSLDEALDVLESKLNHDSSRR